MSCCRAGAAAGCRRSCGTARASPASTRAGGLRAPKSEDGRARSRECRRALHGRRPQGVRLRAASRRGACALPSPTCSDAAPVVLARVRAGDSVVLGDGRVARVKRLARLEVGAHGVVVDEGAGLRELRVGPVLEDLRPARVRGRERRSSACGRTGCSHVDDEAGHAGALPVEVLRVVLALHGRREGRGGGEEKVEQPHERPAASPTPGVPHVAAAQLKLLTLWVVCSWRTVYARAESHNAPST